MTARKILLATFGIVVFATAASEARPRPGGHLGGRSFDANKTFGLGLELGAPTGLNGKYFLSPDRALDFGIGDLYTYFNRSGLHLYGDYLFHPVSLLSTEPFELPLYIGVGGRFWDFGYRDPNNNNVTAFAIGVRVPVGVSFDFNNVPLDIFIQVVPVLDFFSGYAPHTVFFDVDGSFGIRYWFN
jgi:hypothetical protein